MNGSATSNTEQIEAVVKVVEHIGLDEIVRRTLLKYDSGACQRVLAQGNALVIHMVLALETKLKELATIVVGFLKLISGGTSITIGATDGQATIAKAGDLFTGWLDSDFVNYGTDVPGQATKDTPVQVFEMIKDGTFQQIFGGFGQNLDRLCLTQAQIIRFVKDHNQWLHPEGWATFFLFRVGTEYFVANVNRHEGGLWVNAYRLSDDGVWRAGYRLRIVVPQL